jgi:predicted metal-binding protein
MNIGEKIDALQRMREMKRAMEDELANFEKEMGVLEQDIIASMEAEGMSRAAGETASCVRYESVRPTVENWEEFYEYIHRNKYYHLLDRRASVTGCRELFETKGQIPGVTPFVRQKVRITALKS